VDAGDGFLVGFIDWDLAGPAEPIWDLAFMALTWVPLTAREVAAADGFPPTSTEAAGSVCFSTHTAGQAPTRRC